jgi:CHAT domain-containing protein
VQASSARADSLLAQVKQQFPQYASLSNPGPAELKDVQAALGPREAMIVFVIGVNNSYGLLVTRDGLDVQQLKIGQADLDDDVADLRKAFMPALGRLPQFSLKTSNDLYQALIAPFEAKLASVDSLIVVPNGSIANLPLSLLVTEPPAGDGNDYAQAAWLVRRMAVSNMPSPRAFLSLRDEREHHAPAPRGFLGVANPAYAGTSGAAGAKALSALAVACRDEGPIDPALLRALPPLPETAGEVQTVAAHLGGGNPTILSGGNATEPELRAQALDQYAVVYFATHGILPGELHCAGEPGLALSPPSRPASSTASDGLLTASEIAQLKLNADLVVLSACNTAESGSANGGGSLEGLADSFFAAGARAVLASHWQVPSGATEHLMVGVFDRTGRGGSDLAQALRQSQLQLISQPATAHPFNWAAFTIIGDGETLAPANVQSAKAGE